MGSGGDRGGCAEGVGEGGGGVWVYQCVGGDGGDSEGADLVRVYDGGFDEEGLSPGESGKVRVIFTEGVMERSIAPSTLAG